MKKFIDNVLFDVVFCIGIIIILIIFITIVTLFVLFIQFLSSLGWWGVLLAFLLIISLAIGLFILMGNGIMQVMHARHMGTGYYKKELPEKCETSKDETPTDSDDKPTDNT